MKIQGIISILVSFILATAIIAAVGCDNKSGKAKNAAQPSVKKVAFDPKDPCPLLTKEEVGAVLKRQVIEASADDGRCTYYSNETTYTSFGLTVQTPPEGAAAYFKLLRDAPSGDKERIVKKIEGTGEGAYYELSGAKDRTIYSYQGKYFVFFTVSRNDGGDISDEGMRELAKKAMDRI